MEEKIEKLSMEDGRQAERHIKEDISFDNEHTRTIDLYVEPERKKVLSKRIVEKKRPYVYRREIETLDENGNIIDKQIESVDPEEKMHVVSHIAAQSSVVADDGENCDCPMTKNDLKEVLGMFVDKLNADRYVDKEPVSVETVQDHVAPKLDSKNEFEMTNTSWILLMVAVAQVAGIAYIFFVM